MKEEVRAGDIAVPIAQSRVGPVDDRRVVAIDHHVERVEVTVARHPLRRVELGQQLLGASEGVAQLGIFVSVERPAHQREPARRETRLLGLGPPIDRDRVQPEVQVSEAFERARRRAMGLS